MKLSIIIPVYNSEKYLTQCLRSVFTQDLSEAEYEVIVINDGSTDQSKNIILYFKQTHKNLILIDQMNQGVSVARNKGLEISIGEYVTFVDSDDRIISNSFIKIYHYLDRLELDVLYASMVCVDEEGNQLYFQPAIGKHDIIEEGFIHGRRTFPPTFYRKTIIQNIIFNSDISVGEDSVFNAMVQSFAKRVSYFEMPYYQYTVRANSLSKQGKSDKGFQGFVKAITELRRFQNENFNDTIDAKNYFDQVYEIFVTRILELNVMPEWNKKNYDRLRETLATENLLYILDGFSQKYPHSNRSFFLFTMYQRYLSFKSYICRILYRND